MLSITRSARLVLAVAVLAAIGCGGRDKTSGLKQLTPASVTAQTSTTISAVVGSTVSPAPSVRVTSSDGQPVPNVTVSFSVGAASGTISTTSAATGTDGVATAGQWTLGTTAGTQHLTATVAGLTGVDFAATAQPDVPASVAPNGSATLGGTVGTAVATLPAAIVKDKYGNPVPGVAVAFAVTQGGGTLTGANATTDASGVARPASWTLGNTAGANILTATVAGIATPATFTATAAAGPATALSFVAGSGQTGTVNTALAVSPAVRATDTFGNPVAGQAVSFTAATGSVASASAATGADGVASAGTWTLGKTAGTNSLTAKLGTLSATVTALGMAAAPSALVAVTAPPASLPVASNVTPKPSVRVTDAYANVIAGASVVFTVQSGGGTVAGGSVSSDANGVATVGGWTIGTHTGTQTLRASLGTISTLDFSVNAVAGPPAQVVLAGGANQYGRVGSVLPVSPSVQVLDTYSNAVGGAAVTFAPVGVSGSVSGGTATTNSQGIAAVGSWTLGPSEGVDSLFATVGAVPSFPIYARVVPISQFNITLRFLTPVTATQQAAFQRAAERWRDVVIGDLPDVSASLPANACGVGEPALNETIDDVLIYVRLDSIDGPGKVLGSAGPCATRTLSGLPALGAMHFDTADVAQLEADNQLDAVILHEMGHVLGIGSLWSSFGLLTGAGTSDPFFTGAAGRQGFSLVGGDSYLGNPVPVENQGGAGTVDSHWRESVLNTELMTGYISPPGVRNPLSLVTIGSLEDLGYSITPWGYDVFTFGVDLREGAQLPARELRELPPQPPRFSIDDWGRMVPHRAPAVRRSAGTSRLTAARRAPRQPQSITRRR